MLQSLLNLDGAFLLWLQDCLRTPLLDAFFSFYTKLGDAGLFWIVLSLLLLFFRPTRKAGLVSLTAMLLGLLCTNVVLKHLVGRTRPWLMVEGLIHLVEENDPNSFPSGHTCAAFASAIAWLGTLPKRWMKVTALVLAVLMGFSRLYVGVHFPSDVLAGALVGAACGWLALQLWRRLDPQERL